MQYKVLSASLGRNGEIYQHGSYIEIESQKEAEELSSFGCILIEKEVLPDKKPEEEVLSEERVESHSTGVKTQKGGRKKK